MSKSLSQYWIRYFAKTCEGEGAVSVGKVLNLAQSTVSALLKNANIICNAAENVSVLSAKCITKVHAPVIEEMDRFLELSVHDTRHRKCDIAVSDIQVKALSLFVSVKEHGIGGLDCKDIRCQSWLIQDSDRFKRYIDAW